MSSERSSLAATPAQAIADGISEVILTATALDSSGAPVPGAAVDFTASLGALSSARVVTGSAGVATTTLRSTRPGNATVGASVGGVVLGTPAQVSFVAGPAATLRVTAQPSGGTAGVGLVELSVEARDANDNATTFPAEVTVSLRTSPAGAVLSGTSRATPAGASVSFAGLSVQKAGDYVLRLSSGTLFVDTAVFTVAPGSATQLAFVTAPTGPITAGEAFDVTVAVVDAYGNVCASAATVNLSVTPQAALVGTTVVEAVAGRASFAGLSIRVAGAGYRLTAAAPALGSATSDAFEVQAATPSTLAFVTQPTNAVAGVVFSPPVRVGLVDAWGNAVLGDTGTSISLALMGASSTALGTSLQATAGTGVVVFDTLAVPVAAVGYRLMASATGLKRCPSITREARHTQRGSVLATGETCETCVRDTQLRERAEVTACDDRSLRASSVVNP